MRLNLNERAELRGHVRVVLKDRDGNVVEQIEQDNLVVDAGRNLLRDFLLGNTVSGLNYIAIGTGTSEPLPTDTQLENEIDRRTFSAVTSGNRYIKISAFYTFDEVNTTITEAGLFGNGATADPNTGTLYARTLFATPIVKTPDTTLTIEWTLNF